MSLYSLRKGAGGAVQPWSEVLPFGKHIRDYYDSLGDVNINTPTQIATMLDGPEKVVRFGALAVSSTLTASQRCKSLTIICDSLHVLNGGNINMTGKGARVDHNADPRFPFNDLTIPNAVGLYSEAMSKKVALEIIRKYGFAPWDRGFWDADGGLNGFALNVAQAGEVTLVSAAGCGVGANSTYAWSVSGIAGYTGGAGSAGATGGGGSGASYSVGSSGGAYSTNANNGCVYGGGSGSGGCVQNTNQSANIYPPENGDKARYSSEGKGVYCAAGSAGGGAGNPGAAGSTAGQSGGDGVGGRLIIIVFGSITVDAGAKIEANGMPGGGSGASSGGGGSGGGSVIIISPSAPVNAGTIQAAGGVGGSGTYPGGAGGAGSVVTKTFAQMGTAWT